MRQWIVAFLAVVCFLFVTAVSRADQPKSISIDGKLYNLQSNGTYSLCVECNQNVTAPGAVASPGLCSTMGLGSCASKFSSSSSGRLQLGSCGGRSVRGFFGRLFGGCR